jgi:hypothetical protein
MECIMCVCAVEDQEYRNTVKVHHLDTPTTLYRNKELN